MAVHKLKDVTVEKQQDSTLCWASITRAVLTQFELTAPTQTGLRDEFSAQANQSSGLTRGQFSVDKALDARNVKCPGESVKVTSYADKSNWISGLDTALGAALDAGRPVVFGITTSDSPGLELLDGSGVVKFRHALFVYSYDDETQTVGFMDPARGTNAARSESLGRMLSGFAYATPADLGPTMATKVTVPRKLFCRVFKVFYPQKPILNAS
jgi:hypothetical protein